MNYYLKVLSLAILSAMFLGSCSVSRKTLSESDPQKDSVTFSTDWDLTDEESEKIYRPERTKVHKLIHTKLEVGFDWEKRRLLGKATIELSPYFYPQKELELDAKNFDIHRLGIIQNNDTIALEYRYDNFILTIDLDRTYYRNEILAIYIDYTAKPYEREAGGSAAIQSDRGLFFVNHDGKDNDKPRQIWTQGETEHNSNWFPTIDSPNQRSTQEIYITVEDKFVTLSNGLLISSVKNPDGTRTDYWKQDLSHTPYLFMMAIGEFAVVKDYWEGIEVSYYVEPAFEPYARSIFGNTPEMMTFFSDLLGYKYPWPKYAQVVVRDFVSGAMENTTASVFMEDLQIDDRELLDYHWDGIIAHELFHHWFGNLLTCESWANLPLNEAFANYSEYLWYEYKYGKEEADHHNQQELNQYLQESQSKKVDLIRFYYDDKESMFDSHSYAKGGRILHMLRLYLGDTAFFESLKHFLHKHEFSDVEVHDMRLAFEEVTGKDLNWFFNQWFLAAGHPQIKVEHSYENGELTIETWQQQDNTISPIYKLPVDVSIWVGEEVRTYSIEMRDEHDKFVFPVEQMPNLVLFDGKHQMLAEIEHEKTREEMVFQYYHSGAFLPRYQALEYLSNDIDHNIEVLLDALDDSFWGLRQFAISALDGYKGERVATLEEKIKTIALNDNKAVVRADALSMLSIMDLNNHKDLFLQSLNDSSYSVVGVSLMAISESNIEDKVEIFSQYEDINNLNVFLPIASYYARNDQYKKYDWFNSKVNELRGTDLWYMLQFFGEYLMNAPEDQKKKGVSILETEARNNGSYYIRLAAYQALGLLEDLEGVAKIREDIRKNETDNRLNRIYSNLN
jgi:aminopeptidase N